MIRKNKCDACEKEIKHGEKVSVLIKSVEASGKVKAKKSIHLKLSERALGSRAFRVYCQECLDTRIYFND